MKEWTIMFYFASDNPLASGIVSQLKAIKDAGFHKQANVIAYFDPHTKKTPNHVFEVNLVNKLKTRKRSDVGFGNANDPFVRNLVFDKIWEAEFEKTKNEIRDYLNSNAGRGSRGGHIDYNTPPLPEELSGEPSPVEALGGFLRLCRESYQARHYILFILGHGQVVGNDVFLFDATIDEADDGSNEDNLQPSPPGKQARSGSPTPLKPAQHSLTLKDLGTVLQGFKDNIGDSQFELVGFHGCSMSGLELAYQIQGTANYMMASQGPSFIGSFPYKNILIRLFNDLDASSFKPRELKFAPLIARLKDKEDEVCQHIREHCFDSKTRALLDKHDDARKPGDDLRDALFNEMNNFLDNADFHKSDAVRARKMLAAEIKEFGDKGPQGTDLMWLNRGLLENAFGEGIKGKEKEQPSVKQILTNFFYFCLHNSLDFQLAGYSFDLTLCDLSKLKDKDKGIHDPLKELSEVLIQALELNDELVRALILLAHLKAISFFQEQYTDLYDFCFCLNNKCKEAAPFAKVESTAQILVKIQKACARVMGVLQRGAENDDDRLVVRSEFIGPEFQYSHGFSIFFPWSQPVDNFFSKEYEKYRLIKDFEGGKTWQDFLKTYFKETMRDPHFKEEGKSYAKGGNNLERRLLDLLQSVSNSVFSSEASSPDMLKIGGLDPLSGDCSCPSIKNYPPSTGGVPLGPNYVGSEQAAKKFKIG